MRIAFISDKAYPFYQGGYERRVYFLAKSLSASHEVSVFTSLGVSVERFQGVTFQAICRAPSVGRFHRDRNLWHTIAFALVADLSPLYVWKPDLVVLEATPFVHLPRMAGALRLKAVPFLVDVSEAWSSYLPADYLVNELVLRIVRWSLSSGLRGSSRVLAVSRATAASLLSHYGLPSDKVCRLPNGIDLDPISESTSPALGTNQETEKYDFISVGRLTKSKRLLDFVAALQILKSELHWAGRAVIIGDGPDRFELNDQIKKRHLDQQVLIRSGVSDEEKFRILSSSQVFVLPSEREGFSIAALEAAVTGHPVVAARPKDPEVFGVSDFVTDNLNGWFYPAGNIRKLAERLDFASRGAERRAPERNLSRELQLEYNWTRIGQRLNLIVDDVSSQK